MSDFCLLKISDSIPTVNLQRDLTKHLKRGHLWIYADSFDQQNSKLKNYFGLAFIQFKKELLGIGIYQAQSTLRFRMICLSDLKIFKKNEISKTLTKWSQNQWDNAIDIRKSLNHSVTSAYRLINGEGDGFPGLIIDIYSQTAVIKFDHNQFEDNIWNLSSIQAQLLHSLPHLDTIYLKRKNEDSEREKEAGKGKVLFGELKEEVIFKENNILFSANIRDGSKTGFFLDQRDNRELIKSFSKNKSILNLFSYTGGFSVYAAAGGARSVTSVDIARPAIEALNKNYEINNLKIISNNRVSDVFNFLEDALNEKQKYDLVINDPPSFAPNAKSVSSATQAYIKIFSDSLRLVSPNGLFAVSSCSSHISNEMFLQITKESFSKARCRGTVLHIGGQPIDHPFPLAMDEFRYLKFILFRVTQ